MSMNKIMDRLSGIGYIFGIVWKYDRLYIPVLALETLVRGFAPLVNVIMPKYIIDELLGQRQVNLIFTYIALLILLNLATQMTMEFINTVFMNVHTDRLQNRFAFLMGEKIMEMDYGLLETPKTHDMRSRADRVHNGSVKSVLGAISTILSSCVTVTSIIFIIGTLSLAVVLLVMCVVCITAAAEMKTRRKYYDMHVQLVPTNRRLSYLMRLINDFANGKEIRLFGLSSWLRKKNEDYYRVVERTFTSILSRIYGVNAFIVAMRLTQEAFVYGYLAIGVIRDMISLGDFTMYLNAVRTFSGSLASAMSAFIDISQNCLYIEDFRDFMNIPNVVAVKRKDGRSPRELQEPYYIEFENVSFKYPGSDTYALRNITVQIESGQKVSVVGQNGAGKTTLVKLLTRLYDPSEGRILLNGVDIREFDYAEYLALFSVVFQDYKIFAFSLRENITLADSDNPDEELLTDSVNKSGLLETINRLPKGMDTSIYKIFDDKGIELSGGEQQKLVLARALYKNAPIVILDEPTSSLDPLAEYDLYRRFNDLIYNRTAIYISHRLSSSRFSDLILVLREGELVERGSHQQLLRENGLYSDMFRLQAQYYVEDSQGA